MRSLSVIPSLLAAYQTFFHHASISPVFSYEMSQWKIFVFVSEFTVIVYHASSSMTIQFCSFCRTSICRSDCPQGNRVSDSDIDFKFFFARRVTRTLHQLKWNVAWKRQRQIFSSTPNFHIWHVQWWSGGMGPKKSYDISEYVRLMWVFLERFWRNFHILWALLNLSRLAFEFYGH